MQKLAKILYLISGMKGFLKINKCTSQIVINGKIETQVIQNNLLPEKELVFANVPYIKEIFREENREWHIGYNRKVGKYYIELYEVMRKKGEKKLISLEKTKMEKRVWATTLESLFLEFEDYVERKCHEKRKANLDNLVYASAFQGVSLQIGENFFKGYLMFEGAKKDTIILEEVNIENLFLWNYRELSGRLQAGLRLQISYSLEKNCYQALLFYKKKQKQEKEFQKYIEQITFGNNVNACLNMLEQNLLFEQKEMKR